MVDRVSFDGEVFAGQRQETKMDQFVAHPGDLVVSKIRARQGSIGIVTPELGQVGVSIHYRALTPDADRIDLTYAWLALRSKYCRAQFLVATGGAMKGEISEDALLAINVPLPSLAVQRRIVARWRDAQKQIAAAKQRVEDLKAKSDAEFLKGLGFAFTPSGKLPKVFAVGWQDFDRWSVSFNQQTCASLNLETGKYPVVPLGSILEMVQYGTSEKANTEGKGTPVLRICNLKEGGLDLGDIKHVALPVKVRDSLLVRDGDMLIIRTSGSRDLVGTNAVFHSEAEFVFASYLIRLRFDSRLADSDFVSFVLNSSLGRQQINAVSRQIMQSNINSEELRDLQIPLPPLPVQRQLVERVTAARAEIARERAAADQLAQSIAAEVETLILGQSS